MKKIIIFFISFLIGIATLLYGLYLGDLDRNANLPFGLAFVGSCWSVAMFIGLVNAYMDKNTKP